MATAPLFNTLEVLKAGLRLSGATQPDFDAILDRTLLEVRVGFYDKLGESLISSILTTTLVASPTTPAQIARTKASIVEVLWAKYFLLLELPTMFMDSSGQAEQVWNQEGLIRESTTSKTNKLREDLSARIDMMLDELSGIATTGGVRATTIEPGPPDPLRPRESISLFRTHNLT
jgi:hypothetical protein